MSMKTPEDMTLEERRQQLVFTICNRLYCYEARQEKGDALKCLRKNELQLQKGSNINTAPEDTGTKSLTVKA